jgi:ElaB/YqjD/DUF883 family membrane-anchored ribosome-binding protein
MNEKLEGSGAAAVGAHSKDAMQSGAMPGGRPQGIDPSAVGTKPGGSDDTMQKAREMAGEAKGFADDAAGSARGLADDAADRARGLADEARERVGEYGAQAGQMARQAGETLSQAGSEAYRQGQQATDYLNDRVREEPLLALLGAGAIGFALGVLIARR